MCGCGLGGVAGSIGLFGGVAINIWKPAALKAAIKTAIANSADKIAEAANSAGIQAGKEFVIAGLKRMGISTLGGKDLGTYFATTSYKNITNIAQAVYEQHFEKCADYPLWSVRVPSSAAKHDFLFCQSVSNQIPSVSQPKQYISRIDVVQKTVQNIVTKAEGVAADASAVKSAELTAEITKEQTTAINTIFMSKQTAIIASVVAILIIVLIMAIAAATKAAIAKGTAKGLAAGAAKGVAEVIAQVESQFRLSTIGVKELGSIFNASNYTNETFISGYIYAQYQGSQCGSLSMLLGKSKPFCTFVEGRIFATSVRVGRSFSPEDFIKTTVQTIVKNAKTTAEATKAQVASAEKAALQ
ncbi:hypothetical protein PFNF54_00350 [Plasmodium falciparum NF54]|uniref:Rifin n=1 Tax=Plasmodium falciparum (isolate NF54) TaxID=5843 RepID=W7KAN3_PLAFO|nr:hypothetical protein PFNF54_00350 [Plasmodium falciparum NF54]